MRFFKVAQEPLYNFSFIRNSSTLLYQICNNLQSFHDFVLRFSKMGNKEIAHGIAKT